MEQSTYIYLQILTYVFVAFRQAAKYHSSTGNSQYKYDSRFDIIKLKKCKSNIKARSN